MGTIQCMKQRILEQAFPDTYHNWADDLFAVLGHSLYTMPVSPGCAGITPVLKQ